MKVKRRSPGYLTITVLSAKGLKDVRHFGGLMGTYVTVRLGGKHQQATRKVTSGGGSPKWHEPFDFKLEGWKESMRPPAWLLDADDEAGKFLVEIIHAGLLGQRVVGRRLVNEEDAVDLAQKGFTYHSFGLHGPQGEDVDGYVNLRLEFRPTERGAVKVQAGGAGVAKAVGEGGGGRGVMEKKSGGITAAAAAAAESKSMGEEDLLPSKLVSPGGTPLPSTAALWKPLNNKESSADGTRNSGGSWDDLGEKKTGNGRKGERRSRDGEIPFSGGWVTEGGGGGGGGGGLRNVRVSGGKVSAANNGSSNLTSGTAGNGRRFKPLRVHSSTLPFQHPKQVHPDTGSRPVDTSNSKDEVGSATSDAQLADEDPDSTTNRPAAGSLDLGWPMMKVVPPLTLKQQTGIAIADAELPSPIQTSGQAPPSSLSSPTTPPNNAPAGVTTPRGPKNHASLPRVLSHSSPSSEDYDFDPRTYYVAMPSDGKIPPPLYVSKFSFSAPLEEMEGGSDARPSSGRRHSTGGGGRGGVVVGGGSRHIQRRSLSLSRPSGLHSPALQERRQHQVNAASSFSFDHPNYSNVHLNEMGSGGEGKYFDNIEAEDFPETGEGRGANEGPDSNPGERYGSQYGGEGEWGDDVDAFDHPYGYGNEKNENDFEVDEHPYSFAGTASRRTGRGGSFGEFDRNDVLMSRSGPLLTTSSSKKLADFGKRRSKSIKENRYREGNPAKTRSAMAAALATFVRLVRPGGMKSGGGKVSTR